MFERNNNFSEKIHPCIILSDYSIKIVTGLENDMLNSTGLIGVQDRTVILITSLLSYQHKRICRRKNKLNNYKI